MTLVLAVARLALAAVFAVAAVAKLAGRERFQETLGTFGVPRSFLTSGAWLVALTELALAGLLVPSTTGRPAALAASALAIAFSAVVARTLRSGKRPDCGCFGSLSAAPIGWTTLARNAALVALAGAVAVRPAPALGWVESASGGGTALLLLQGWLWFELLRRYGRALGRIAELESDDDEPSPLEVGDEAPRFALPDLHGRLVSLESLLEESEETLLLFTNPSCGACEVVLADPAASGAVVVSNRSAGVGQHGGTVLLDEESKVMELYRVAAVPTAVLVDRNGRVAVPPVVGATGVVELVHASFPLRLAGEAA
jgi:methylamine utilization protein MauE